MTKDEIRRLLECAECRQLVRMCYILTLMNHLLRDHGMTSKEAIAKTMSVYKILGERKHRHHVIQEAV
jgi:hypothetical protein